MIARAKACTSGSKPEDFSGLCPQTPSPHSKNPRRSPEEGRSNPLGASQASPSACRPKRAFRLGAAKKAKPWADNASFFAGGWRFGKPLRRRRKRPARKQKSPALGKASPPAGRQRLPWKPAVPALPTKQKKPEAAVLPLPAGVYSSVSWFLGSMITQRLGSSPSLRVVT